MTPERGAASRSRDARRLFERADAGAGRGNGSRRRARRSAIPRWALDANYGDTGASFANSHGNFAVTGIAEVQHFRLAEKFAPMSSRPTP